MYQGKNTLIFPLNQWQQHANTHFRMNKFNINTFLWDFMGLVFWDCWIECQCVCVRARVCVCVFISVNLTSLLEPAEDLELEGSSCKDKDLSWLTRSLSDLQQSTVRYPKALLQQWYNNSITLGIIIVSHLVLTSRRAACVWVEKTLSSRASLSY